MIQAISKNMDRILEPLPDLCSDSFDDDALIYKNDYTFYYNKEFPKNLIEDIRERTLQIYSGYYEWNNGWSSPKIYLIGRGLKSGKFKMKVQNFLPYCYVDSYDNSEYETYLKQPVKKLVFIGHPSLVAKFRDIRRKQGFNLPYEADVLFVRRFLCDVYDYFKSKDIIQPKIAIIDIENDHPVSENIIAYSINNMKDDIIYDSKFTSNSAILTLDLLDHILEYDIITGWNIDFDISCLNTNLENLDRYLNLARQNRNITYNEYVAYYEKSLKVNKSYVSNIIDALISHNYLRMDKGFIRLGDRTFRSNNSDQTRFKSIISEEVAILDLLQLSKKMLAREIRGKWTLGNVGMKICGMDKINLGSKKIRELDEMELMLYNVMDVIIPEVIDNVLGGLDSHIILGWSLQSLLEDLMEPAVVNDIALLRAYHKNKIVLPSRLYDNNDEEEESRYKAAEPDAKPGIYRGILVFDLVSAYPFAVISKNISPETKDPYGENVVKYIDKDGNEKEVRFNNNESVFINTLKSLIDERQRIKSILNTLDINSTEYKRFKSIDFALKTQAAAFSHGIFGWANSRMVDYEVADAITAIVRNLLNFIKICCSEINIEYIYNHTDSIYINAKQEDKDNILNYLNRRIKEYCKDFKVLPVLEFKGYYEIAYIHSKARNVLLASEKDVDHPELWDEPPNKVTGMNFMRAETPEELADIEMDVIKQKFKGISNDDIIINLRERIKNLKNVDSIRLGLIKPLTKDIKEYGRTLKDGSVGGLPYHIKALLKANEEYGFSVSVGDKFMILPIITNETEGKKKIRRKRIEIAFPIESGLPDTYKIDFEYYLRSNLWGKICGLLEKNQKELEHEIMIDEVKEILEE